MRNMGEILESWNGNLPNWGTLEELGVGDAFKITNIRQGLPQKEYHPLKARRLLQIEWYENDFGKKLKVSVPEEDGKRYILLTRIE